ncbi:MAG: potassium transporter TrkG [Firmicutes bacterium]|nr:potassium transporter TrkG [Bacillota bacterium]
MGFALKKKLSYFQIIAISFILIILVGSFLLMLPCAVKDGQPPTNYIDALFTSVSATCVTGLVVFDTFLHWSVFGQTVILVMIQIGGLGFMTLMSMVFMLMRKNIGLHERKLMMQSASMLELGGVVKTFKRILFGTAFFELCGAVILSTQFCPKMGLGAGIYASFFHSVSAFCNAGFDILGRYGEFSSLSYFGNNPIVMITIMCLIVAGGIGFLVWDDFYKNRFHLRKYKLHSKIVLSTTFTLLFVGALLFYIFEKNHAFAGMSVGEKLLHSAFQSVTPRTAGFSAVDPAAMSDSGILLTDLLMLIGGSPGSTAGGIKTVTATVLVLNALSLTRHNGNISIFKRRIDSDFVRQAAAIFVTYFCAVVTSTLIICAIDNFSLKEVLFESFSAVGTVGLSLGITPYLSFASKIVIMLLMFGGRIGAVTLLLIFARKKSAVLLARPTEKISLG